MIEGKVMFGVAALGLSAVVGYGLYRYVRGKQHAQKIKEAIDGMVGTLEFMIFGSNFICRSSCCFACSKLIFYASLL